MRFSGSLLSAKKSSALLDCWLPFLADTISFCGQEEPSSLFSELPYVRIWPFVVQEPSGQYKESSQKCQIYQHFRVIFYERFSPSQKVYFPRQILERTPFKILHHPLWTKWWHTNQKSHFFAAESTITQFSPSLSGEFPSLKVSHLTFTVSPSSFPPMIRKPKGSFPCRFSTIFTICFPISAFFFSLPQKSQDYFLLPHSLFFSPCV